MSDECDVAADLCLARFHRISKPYRTAFAWASLVHRGVRSPDGRTGAGAFWLDAPKVFERFVERLAQSAFPGDDVGLQDQKPGVFKRRVGAWRPGTRPDLVLSPRGGGLIAIGDAKYKDVCETLPPSSTSSVPFSTVIAQVSAADTYQLYTHLRLRGCSTGFFVVPFWDPQARAIAVDREFVFTTSPLDGNAPGRAFAIGLNLAKNPLDVLHQGQKVLCEEIFGDPVSQPGT